MQSTIFGQLQAAQLTLVKLMFRSLLDGKQI